MRSVTSCAIGILVIWVLVLCILWWLQYRILFYPSSELAWIPTDEYEEFYLNQKSEIVPNAQQPGVVNGWWFVHNPKMPTVLFCHGNSGNISHRSYMVNFCKLFGLNVVLFDYRGYGKSSGISNVGTLHLDATVVYRYVTSKVSSDQIIIWGESLGGALASHLASNYPCRDLVLMATFSSLDDILLYREVRFASALSLVLRLMMNTMRSKDILKNVKCPVIIAHSPDDEMIPFACSKVLYDSIPGDNKLFIEIKGTHASPILTPDEVRTIMDFLKIPHRQVANQDIQTSLDEIRTVVERYNLL